LNPRSFQLSAATGSFLALLLLFPTVQPLAHAQYEAHPSGIERLTEGFTAAADDALAWYDGPIYLVYLVNVYDIVPQDAKPIVIGPSDAERALARGIGVPGASSPGSLEPFTIPHLLIASRMLYTAGRTILDDRHDPQPGFHQALGFYKALVYTQVTTQFAKNLVHRERPDKSDSKSFFSGHTSTTFAMSSYLQRELDDAIFEWDALRRAPVLRNILRAGSAAALYGWAGYVGYSRMRDQRHYLTDVIVGAAIGSLIGHFVYGQVNQAGTTAFPGLGIAPGEDGPLLSLRMQF